MNPFIPLLTLLLIFVSSFNAQAQTPSTSVKVTIRAVSVFSTYSRRNEDERYRYRFWIDGTELPNDDGCLKVGGTPGTWTSVDYGIAFQRNFDLEDDIVIEAEGWEDDGCKDACRYNDTRAGCDDGGRCGRNPGTVVSVPSDSYTPRNVNFIRIKQLRPGNVSTNLVTINYCGGDYRVQYLVTYTIPTPTRTTYLAYDDVGAPITVSDYQLCNRNKIELNTSTSLEPKFNSQVKYEWYFNINGEKRTVYDNNPAYCGDSPRCDLAEPTPDPSNPILQSISFEKSARSSASSPVVLALPPDEGGPPPPCCYELPYIPRQETVWTKIPGASNPSVAGGKYDFDIRTLKTSKWDLSNISQTAVVNFRVRVTANGSVSEYSVASLTLNVAPLPPVFGSDPLVDKSCPNGSDGIIHLSSVTGIGNYKYNLRPGFDNTTPCDPAKDKCFEGGYSGAVSGGSFDINGIPKGKYTVWLVNFATKSGSCASTKNVEVLSHETLAIALDSKEDVVCNGNEEGKITLNKTGGKAPYTYTLTGQPFNNSGVFENLIAGEYHATVTDGCLQSIATVTDRNVTINQPIKISESVFSSSDATCATPGNGSLTSAVSKSSGSYDKLVSPTVTYQFRLFKDNALYDSYESTTAQWTRPNLPVSGDYDLVVTEKGGIDCNGYTKTFKVDAPDPLTVDVLKVDEVSCFGGTNGKVTFEADGGSGQFIYKMSAIAGDTVSNTDGEFTTLPAGLYTLVLQNGLSGCRDQLTHSTKIDVIQPKRIKADLNKTDITCFGNGDGKIFATLEGGTPGYSSVWQEQVNFKWISLPRTGTSIDKREAGTFRLMITDSRTCRDSSSAVTIIEPSLLSISKVTVSDIKCLNETGTIELASIGGTGDHTFFYSRNNAADKVFTSVTPLSAGSYVVKVKDVNGCTDIDEGTYAITSPPSMLDFNYELSDFNGFNISCFGGSNGHAVITANGGNGSSYLGYRFSKDDREYQPEVKVEGFNAGTHKITVIDGRGCAVSKNVNFTQTDEAITLKLDNKKDIVCYGDQTGVLNLSATGGLSPYKFKINDGQTQPSGTFTGLASNSYRATVYDKNNCDAVFDYSIEILNPPIEIKAELKDVSCFAGSDGSITISIDGGVSPFEYAWPGQTSTSNILSDVKLGQYKVVVTDNAGCKRDSLFSISQPLKALENKINTVPVCFGRTTGVITILPSGGTSPFQFSIDNGATFQAENIFSSVGVGSYQIKVIDDKGCISLGKTEVIQRNDQPIPDFIVASKEYARDTLVIREISVPKPDSVHWIFDSNAILTRTEQWSPEIVFEQAGEYSITMIGYFQACDYAVTRTITLNPYDPNATPVKDPSYKPIQSVDVTPNPNNGEFDVTVKLNKKYRLSLVIYDVLGGLRYLKSFEPVQSVTERIKLPEVASGVYMLRAITNTDAKDVRIIINK